MSKLTSGEVTCKFCGKTFEVKYWESVNADVDPHLKAELLTGELFLRKCPKCKRGFRLDYTLLYHDMTNDAMIWMVHNDDEANDMVSAFQGSFMTKWPNNRIVKGYNELKEKISIIDAKLDDRVIEIMKVLIFTFYGHLGLGDKFSWIYFESGIPNKFVWLEKKQMFCLKRGDYIEETVHEHNLDMSIYQKISVDMGKNISRASEGCLSIGPNWVIDKVLCFNEAKECFWDIVAAMQDDNVNNN